MEALSLTALGLALLLQVRRTLSLYIGFLLPLNKLLLI